MSESRPGMDELAGVVANVIMQSIQSTAAAAPRSSISLNTRSRSADYPGAGPSGNYTAGSGNDSSRSSSTSSSTRPAFDQAANLRPDSVPKRPRFVPPTLFENSRRGTGRQSSRQSTRRQQDQPAAKISYYSRDVILLPGECQNKKGDITIPKPDKRVLLGRAGLVGKIEIHSSMNAEEVRKEVCEVFSTPMGINKSNLKAGELFPFEYLQRAGSCTRALCLPSVKEDFEWTGRRVASLAKAGSYIYLLALKDLPGYQQVVDETFEENEVEETFEENEVGDNLENEGQDKEKDDDNSSGDELPDFSRIVGACLENVEQNISDQESDPKENTKGASSPTTAEETVSQKKASMDASSSSNIDTTISETDHLVSMFEGTFESKQVLAIYVLSGKKYDLTLQVLLEGCSLKSILCLLNKDFEDRPIARLNMDENSVWSDMLAYYKSNKSIDMQIRVIPANCVAIDTGGIRRQAYSTVFLEFAENRHIHLFDGNTSRLRPATSAMARSCGLLVLLGKMISHSIFQDGIGFPYLSPACYWYLIGNEDMAIAHISFLEDLPKDSSVLVNQIRHASTDEQITEILNDDDVKASYLDVLQRCGISETITMATKEVIVEEITSYEGIGRISKQLDQLAEGLKSLGILKIMKLFPNQFAQLFIRSAVSSEDVLTNMKFQRRLTDGDKIAAGHLRRFVTESSEKVLKDLMLYITGSYQPSQFTVVFVSTDDVNAAVSAHTCPKELHLPKTFEENNEETYSQLCASIIAAMDMTYNTV